MRRQRLQGWEIAREAGVLKLVHELWQCQVFESMSAQVAQGNSVGQRVSTQEVCRLRQKRLPAVSDREEPCYTVEGRAEVIAVPGFHGSSVQGHADLDRRRFGPWFGVKCRLYL